MLNASEEQFIAHMPTVGVTGFVLVEHDDVWRTRVSHGMYGWYQAPGWKKPSPDVPGAVAAYTPRVLFLEGSFDWKDGYQNQHYEKVTLMFSEPLDGTEGLDVSLNGVTERLGTKYRIVRGFHVQAFYEIEFSRMTGILLVKYP